LRKQGLQSAGFEVLADRFPDHPNAIVVAQTPQIATACLMGQLNWHNVTSAERLGRLRLAAHICNSPQQLDDVMEILAKI